jgi:hypothetical protein
MLAGPPLDVLEQGRWARGMGVQEGTMIQRCLEVLSWERLMGGGAPPRVPKTPCRPWMILSSVEDAGTERYAC